MGGEKILSNQMLLVVTIFVFFFSLELNGPPSTTTEKNLFSICHLLSCQTKGGMSVQW
jgi:hypothetical protein